MKGDITLRFHETEQQWEVIFEGNEKKQLHSNTADTLDEAITHIITLVKMMS